MSDDLMQRLESLADCDARSGEPLGKCMREAAARIRELERLLGNARQIESNVQVVREHEHKRAEAAEARLAEAVGVLRAANDMDLIPWLDARDAFLASLPKETEHE